MKEAKAQRHKGAKGLTDSIVYLTAVLSLIIYCLLPLALVRAETVNDIVNRIEKKYGEIHDIQGAFTQTSYLKDLERTEKYSGNFFIRKPSMLRWKYALPRNEEVIINGTEIWIYKASEKQALKSKFNKSAYSQLPIAMLESLENMKADYEIKTAEEGLLELVPKEEMGFVKKIHLETGSGEFPVKTLTIFDMYGNTIILKLKDVKINPGLDDSLFIFKIPQGVEVHDFSQ